MHWVPLDDGDYCDCPWKGWHLQWGERVARVTTEADAKGGVVKEKLEIHHCVEILQAGGQNHAPLLLTTPRAQQQLLPLAAEQQAQTQATKTARLLQQQIFVVKVASSAAPAVALQTHSRAAPRALPVLEGFLP